MATWEWVDLRGSSFILRCVSFIQCHVLMCWYQLQGELSFQLLEMCLSWLSFSCLKFRESFLSGGVSIFPLVPFGFVVKGGDIHAYTLTDLKGCMVVCMVIDEMVVANCGCQCMVIMVVANNSKRRDCCSRWSLCCSCWHQCCSSVVGTNEAWQRIEKFWKDFWKAKVLI